MKKVLSLLPLVFFFFLGFINIKAQSSGVVSSNGASLETIVDHSTIPSGVNLTYTINFSLPAGSTKILIQHQLPITLELVDVIVSSVCGTPVVNYPSPGTMGALIQYQLASVPNACSGTFQIVAKFKAGITCNNTIAFSKTCMSGQSGNGGGLDFCTKGVSTVATATNPWSVAKNPAPGLALSGQQNCYLTASDTISYDIWVAKSYGEVGLLNLVNGIVTDQLPVGATLLSATPSIGTIDPIVGNLIVWRIGNLSSTQHYNMATLRIKVKYAPLTNGQTVTNTARLTGVLGGSCEPSIDISASSCVIKAVGNPPPPSGSLYKWTKPDGNTVGCTGKYYLQVYNYGASTLGAFGFSDVLPPDVTATKVDIYTNGGPATISINGGVPINLSTGWNSPYTSTPINSVNIQSSGLDVQKLIYVAIEFTINANASSFFSNTVNLTGPAVGITPSSVTCPIYLHKPEPKASTYKMICNPKPNTIYKQGDIVRYRLRVQNFGTADMIGAVATDTLNSNLEYIGNPSYYSSTFWEPGCEAPNTSTWSPSPTLNRSGNNLSWDLPEIKSNCQSVIWPNSGYYGTYNIRYYFIDFDVRIKGTSGLGSIINNFVVSGGNLPVASTSPDTYITVVGTHGFTLEKQVSTNGGATYAASGTTSSGANVKYRLQMKNTGTTSFRNALMIDMLPINNGTIDNMMLDRAINRNSDLDINYTNFLASTPHVPVSTMFSTATNICLSEFGYLPTPCASAGWVTGATSSKNVKLDFGNTYLAVGQNLAYTFNAKVGTAKVNQSACNSFAANASKVLIINNVNTAFPLNAVESDKTCVSIQDSKCDCKKIEETFYQGSKDGCNYSFGIQPLDCIVGIEWYIDGDLYVAGNDLFDINPKLSNGEHKICYKVTLSNEEVCEHCVEVKVDCPCPTCEEIQGSFYQNQEKCDYYFGIKPIDKNCFRDIQWYIDGTQYAAGNGLFEINPQLSNGGHNVCYKVTLSNEEVCEHCVKVVVDCPCNCQDIKNNFYRTRPSICEFVFGIKPLKCIENIEWFLDGLPVIITGTMYEINLAIPKGKHQVCYIVTLTNGEQCEACFKVYSNCNPNECACKDIENSFYQKNDGCNYTFGVNPLKDCILNIEWFIDGVNYTAGSGWWEINPTLSNGTHTICYKVSLTGSPWVDVSTLQCEYCVKVTVDCCNCEAVEAAFYQSNDACNYTFGFKGMENCIEGVKWNITDENGNQNTTITNSLNLNEINVTLANGWNIITYVVYLTNGEKCKFEMKVYANCCPTADVKGHLRSCPDQYEGIVILSSLDVITWTSSAGSIDVDNPTSGITPGIVVISNLNPGTYTYWVAPFDGSTKGCPYKIVIAEDSCCGQVINDNLKVQKNTPKNIVKPQTGANNKVLEAKEQTNLQAIPNPANEVLTLKFLASKVADRTIALYTSEGKLVIQKKLDSTDTSIEFDSSNFPNGIFIAQLLEQGKIVNSAKVVIQH